MDTGTPHMAGARGRQAGPGDDRFGWSAPLLRLIHCHPFLSPSALTVSVPTPSIKVIRYCFFPLSLEGAYHPASRISETQPGGVCIRCQKWDSAYILPLTVSGTLGKTHLLSVFPNAPGRGWLDQWFFKGWSADPLEVSEALSGVYKIKTVFLTILRHHLSF